MLTAYAYAMYKDKNRQTPFEFMTSTSPAIIPKGTVVPEGAVIPKGAVIPSGTVLPVGAVIPPQTVIPAGLVFKGNLYDPRQDQFDEQTVKIPRGAQIPRGTVIPANAIIPLNTYLPEGKSVVVPVGAVIPKGAVIKADTVVPNFSVIPDGTVIPENTNSTIDVPSGTIIPLGTVIPKGVRIPKVFTPSVDITSSAQLQTEYLKAYPNATDLVVADGALSILNGKKICIPTSAILPDNMTGISIQEGTYIPKTNSINVPKGTVIPAVDAVEPLDWNASILAKYAHMVKPMGVWGWIMFILDVIILYYAISIALCASAKPSMVALHLILALLFAPFYLLYHILFNSDTYKRYLMMESYLSGDSNVSHVSFVSESPKLSKPSKSFKLSSRQTPGKRYLVSRKSEE
jgi:carbonic anhydrase/acetyltransferase-like protein (isoleucine patch superfamily)